MNSSTKKEASGKNRKRGLDASLESILGKAQSIPLNDVSRWVIFSDLHMGDGGPQDDFFSNAGMFRRVLSSHYLNQGFGLILNGDIEELQRFPLRKVVNRWHDIYDLFRRFETGPGLVKLVGNHDHRLLAARPLPGTFPVREAVRLEYGPNSLLVFHGHQARRLNGFWKRVSPWVLRLLAGPLGIPNSSTAADSRKKFRVEQRVYRFALGRGLAAVIGHTHRPLFESLSKLDTLRFKIEDACRTYPDLPGADRPKVEGKIRVYLKEMQDLLSRKDKYDRMGSLYQSLPPVPSLFNSGCAIGRTGLTGLEIAHGCIALVHWFDGRRTRKYFNRNGYRPERLEGTDYYRVVLKSEPLDYIFTLIRLLSPNGRTDSHPAVPSPLAKSRGHDVRPGPFTALGASSLP